MSSVNPRRAVAPALWSALLGLLFLASLPTTHAATDPMSPAGQVAMAKTLAPSIVQVEYYLQSDKGEVPRGARWGERCPNCGQFHGSAMDEFIRLERPLLSSGFVLSPTQIIAEDIVTHPRFLKSVTVRQNGKSIPAKITAISKNQSAMLLELAEPLTTAKPIKFDTGKKGPYIAVSYLFQNGDWQTVLRPVSAALTLLDKGKPFIASPAASLIVDRSGNAVGMTYNEEMPPDDTWKGSPLQWTWLSQAELTAQLDKIAKSATDGVLRVSLSFRSPKASPRESMRFRGRGDEDDSATERNVLGLATSGNQVMVLAELKPKVTARLQRIVIYTPDGQAVNAKFTGTLREFGAFLVEPEKPLASTVRLATGDILSTRGQMVYGAETRLQGEKRVAYYAPSRVLAFHTGFRNQLLPDIVGTPDNSFVFDESGTLLAFPLSRRESAVTTSTMEREFERDISYLTPTAYLAPVLANATPNLDPANVPLSENDENRIAWLGVELQSLNKDLARANNVSDQTLDGETGGLVTYVYSDSPAAAAGIKPGYILLRLRTATQPNPIEVRVDDDRMFQQAFPWEMLDRIPEQSFDRIPTPWPSPENSFNRMLTDLGMGTEFTAEFYGQGAVIAKKFKVTASPVHYNSATRYKSDTLGITARDLTYEVRRYLQRRPDEPGVVISKIESGSKASVAGVKPYELITHINDQPVNNVKDFERLSKGGGEFNLTIKRMATGRLVKITASSGSE